MKIYLVNNEQPIVFEPPLTYKSLLKIFKIVPTSNCSHSKFKVTLDLGDSNELTLDYIENSDELLEFNCNNDWINSTSEAAFGKIKIESVDGHFCDFIVTLIVLDDNSDREKDYFKLYEKTLTDTHSPKCNKEDTIVSEKANTNCTPAAVSKEDLPAAVSKEDLPAAVSKADFNDTHANVVTEKANTNGASANVVTEKADFNDTHANVVTEKTNTNGANAASNSSVVPSLLERTYHKEGNRKITNYSLKQLYDKTTKQPSKSEIMDTKFSFFQNKLVWIVGVVLIALYFFIKR